MLPRWHLYLEQLGAFLKVRTCGELFGAMQHTLHFRERELIFHIGTYRCRRELK